MSKEVILTGIRANNDLHIGNYFGALLPMVDMAKNRSSEYQVNPGETKQVSFDLAFGCGTKRRYKFFISGSEGNPTNTNPASISLKFV